VPLREHGLICARTIACANSSVRVQTFRSCSCKLCQPAAQKQKSHLIFPTT
jgi:hypothetical protein